MITSHSLSARILVTLAGLSCGCCGGREAGAIQESSAQVSKKTMVLASQHAAAGTSIPDELKANVKLIDIVAPMWFDATDEGTIVPGKGCAGPYTEYKEFCRSHKIQLMPIVRNFAPRTLLTNPDSIKRCVQQVAALTAREGFDGIVIDIEQMTPELQGSLVDLMQQLYPQIRQQARKLVIAVNARGWGKWDYHKLALNADWLYVMFYDYTGPWNKKLVGPTAPVQWPEHTADIQRDLQRILATGAPSEKLLLGVPLYGNDFKLNPEGGALAINTFYLDDLAKLQQKQQAGRKWDEVKKSPYFEYRDAENAAHQVWYEDAASFSNKIQLVFSNQLGGVAIWALRGTAANVNADFWTTVNKQIAPKSR